MSKGFIPIKRSLFKHFLFNEHRVFSRFEAWLDLIQLASFLDGQTDLIKGKVITRNRGEVVASIRWIASRWNWSIHKTCDFVEVLRSQEMVVVGKENGITRLTLVNFEKHNSIGGDEKDSEGNAKGNTQSRTSTALHKNMGTEKGTQKGTVGEQLGNSEGTNINKDNNPNNPKKGEEGADAPPPQGKEGKLKEKQQAMIQRRDEFYRQLAPLVKTYSKKMIRAFFDYWTEPNKSKTRMKFELEDTWDLIRRLTTWEDNDLKWKKAEYAAQPAKADKPPGLSKIQEEVNYLYGCYLEAQVTVISVDWTHYNAIARAGLIDFSVDLVEALQKQAADYIEEKGIEKKEDTITKYAKRFGVLEFFEQSKTQAKETIFHDPATPH